MGCRVSQLPVRSLRPNRLILVLLVSGMLLLALPSRALAQDTDAPLGDVARSFRKKPGPAEAVIDNDNLSKVVDDAESRRVAGLFAGSGRKELPRLLARCDLQPVFQRQDYIAVLRSAHARRVAAC